MLRLRKELAIRMREQARGEMQVAVLAEQMRREGYELILARPEAICQKAADSLLEPFETVHVDIPLESLGHILKSFSRRKAEVVAAVRGGLLSLEEACSRYTLTVDEFLSWQFSIDQHGLAGLRTTRIQQYRQ